MITRRTAISVLGTVLVVSGCSSSGADEDPLRSSAAGPTTSRPEPPTPTPPPVDPAVRARASLVLYDDLPGRGWHQGQSDSDLTALTSALLTCAGAGSVAPTAVPASPDFSMGNLSVDSAAAVFADQAGADRAAAVLGTSRFDRCYRDSITAALKRTFPRGTPLGVTKTTVTARPGSQPKGVVATGQVGYEYTVNGLHGTGHVRVAFVAGPRFIIGVAITKAGSEPPAAVRTAVIAKVAARAAG